MLVFQRILSGRLSAVSLLLFGCNPAQPDVNVQAPNDATGEVDDLPFKRANASRPQTCAPRSETEPQMNGTVSEFLNQECQMELCAPSTRFDDCVREDAFSAYAGDADALDRFWCRLKVHLTQDPYHAAAVAWRGGAYLFASGFAYRAGDRAQGQHLEHVAYADLDRAIELAPNDVGVRIQHMITLAATLRYASGSRKVLSIQQAQRDLDVRVHLTPRPFSEHARGEVWAINAQLQKARYDLAPPSKKEEEQARLLQILEAMAEDTPDSTYAEMAQCWSQGYYDAPLGCHGCHETTRTNLPK